MNEGFDEIRDMIVSMATDAAGTLVAYTPKLIGGLLVLLVGWIVARTVRALVERAIRGGLDGLIQRSGLSAALERTSMTATPSAIVGQAIYWLIMILFLMAGANVLGLTAVSTAITRLFSYLPSVISAALVLAAGVFLARFVGNLVVSGGTAANLSYARGLGAVARSSVVVMVGVVTMEQLGVDTQILVTVITVVVAAIALGMGLAFALGARDVIRAILASHYLRQSLSEGVPLEVDGERGVVDRIGPIYTVFRDGEATRNVPNTLLLDQVIRQ